MPGYSHAIVIGGSMAGLWAARVLADHFERVTVIERDRFPLTPEPRKSVPQAHHVHVLLTQGQRVLERLFPGLDAELAAAGAPSVIWTSECLIHGRDGWAPRYPSELVTRTCSRYLLEWHVRRRLATSPSVHFLERCAVTGLLSDADRKAVTGVLFRRWQQVEASNQVESLTANLVVDASGRNSRTPTWLQALGYEPPKETTINAFLGYASRWYQRPPGLQADWKALLLFPRPPDIPAGGIIYPVEGDRWVVTLAGIARHYPPTDEAGFMDFARHLRVPHLYEAIKDAQPLTPIYGYRRTDNRLLHYERLARWPEGFVVLGDAVCAFNPVYGQGMTTSALGALALDRLLHERRQHHSDGDLRGLGRRFQRQLAKVNATPWLMATSEDFRWPTTEGGRPGSLTRFMHGYLDWVVRAMEVNPVVSLVFWEVTHLLKPPIALLHPRVVTRVLAGLWAR